MELVSLGKEVLQSIAEHAASYRLGQSALRHLDRALWVIEKCARWAVPPPLEQDEERPQPELVRPLPWVFFLMMLVALRVTRESISLVNLVLGKPPLRSADVVMFIQSKRRYLRTLKYLGTRKSRARSSGAPAPRSWYTSLYSMFELTMCFRRQSHCDNNNTTRINTNDELVVVKRGREDSSPSSPSTTENTMERLIEKMMVDLDVESDEESTYTLTNISTPKTDQDTVYLNDSTPTAKQNGNTSNEDIHFSPNTEKDSSTPEKIKEHLSKHDSSEDDSINPDSSKHDLSEDDSMKKVTSKDDFSKSIEAVSTQDNSKIGNGTDVHNANIIDNTDCENTLPSEKQLSDKDLSQNFIRNESNAGTPKKEHKIANGRTVKSVSNKKKGGHRERQQSNEAVQPRALTSNNSF